MSSARSVRKMLKRVGRQMENLDQRMTADDLLIFCDELPPSLVGTHTLLDSFLFLILMSVFVCVFMYSPSR